MYLLIRHELNEITEAKRGEVAEAKARNRQRDAQLRKTSEEPSTPWAHYLTHKQKRGLKIGHRWGHTSQWLHEGERSDGHWPTQAWKGTWPTFHTVRALLVSAPVQEKEKKSRMRHQCRLLWLLSYTETAMYMWQHMRQRRRGGWRRLGRSVHAVVFQIELGACRD
jgi:hypothetical protein